MSDRLPIKITARLQKGSTGNWGHPNKFEKKNTRVNIPLEDVPVRIPNKRKKKKIIKSKYISFAELCPFCGEHLPLDDKKIEEEKSKGIYLRFFKPVVDTCPKCGSYLVESCPCCHRHTWFNPNTRIFQHQRIFNCGFIGEQKK